MQHWLPKNKPGKRLFTGTNENTPGIFIYFFFDCSGSCGLRQVYCRLKIGARG
ncbi:hypothetical protein ASZ90_015057 [hydrocarbon metagenome]|uniref:Uncharacterized protein n=1 Tax=hydrocarbon metagenome TaxID=938273 RepID=A0A0W8F3G5_9ZZZZ